ncbi:MAG: glycoside hydrolase family 3 protein [Treponema sp.]|nr:glycoside hydrolase family 3 protein [Treponema sp.]
MKKSSFSLKNFNLFFVIFVTAFFTGCKTLKTPEPTEPAPTENIIDDAILNMTLEEKIAQMMMPTFRKWGNSPEKTHALTKLPEEIKSTIEKYHLGGIILFTENTPDEKTTKELIDSMQKANTEGGAISKLFIAIDQEGGRVTRLKTGTMMCGNMALGAAQNPELSRQSAKLIGQELSSLGINVNFAPVMDINNNPANPVIGNRSFSDNPELVSKLGQAAIEGFHNQNIITAVKHFPGHGDTSTDSHTGLPSIYKSMEEIKKLELLPYKNILTQTDMLMTAHIRFPKIEKETYISKLNHEEITLPATFSKTFLTDFLRNELNYQGLIISDSMVMDAIAKHFDRMDCAKLAINAGVDIFLMPLDLSTPQKLDDFESFISGIAQMVNDGIIPIEKIDESVKRILSLKYKYGLFTNKDEENENVNGENTKNAYLAQPKTDERLIGTKEHHQKEWEITLKTITLLKNDEKTLPIRFVPTKEENPNTKNPASPRQDSKNATKVLITVAYKGHVNSVNYAVQKLKTDKIIPEESKIDVVYIENPNAENAQKYSAAYDYIIAVMATYGLEDMNPAKKDGQYSGFLDKLLKEAHKAGKKFILLSAQLPYDAARFTKADSIIACYNARVMEELPGDFSNEIIQYGPNIPAAIYTIFGGNNPSGKLPVNVPVLTANYDYASEILYKNGDGIGY